MLEPTVIILVVAAVLGYFARGINRVTTRRDIARRRPPTLYRTERSFGQSWSVPQNPKRHWWW